ncbi:DUF4276 family protein [Thermaerobacter marianensis]
MRIASIVEGHGDVDAVPALLRRIAHACGAYDVRILPPIRVARTHIRANDPELERVVELARYRLQGSGGLIVVFDADTDCPAQLGPSLQQELEKKVAPVKTAVVLAKMEFEAWFLAAIESLRGFRGIRENAVPPPDPESIRGAKEELRRMMVPERGYGETVDQVAFASRFDLQLARSRSPSFDKFYREVMRLLSCEERTGVRR